MKERAFIRWIEKRLRPDPRVEVDVGDDAAVVECGNRIVLKTDLIVEGVHFARSDPLRWVGHKALARVLSDLAAMGALPTFFMVGLCAPSRTRVRELYSGLLSCASRYGIRMVGGDTSGVRGPLMVSVAALGDLEGRAPIERRGAKPGDKILVTGRLGGSRRSHHLRFRPRVFEGLELARSFRIHAMIDISDGLVLDLWRLAKAGKVGAVLYGHQIPISKDAYRESHRTGRSGLDHALYDGEDYELLFAASPSEALRVTKELDARVIGHVIEGQSVRLRSSDGSWVPVDVKGYEHVVGD